MSRPLVCSGCGLAHGGAERFCVRCGMPLVDADAAVLDVPEGSVHGRARKIRFEFTQGELVVVAGARHQAEAELIQGLLLEEGIPSMLRRTRGFDVPDMLAAGPRDVLVPASAASAARDVLLQHEIAPAPEAFAGDRPGRVLAVLGGLVAVVGLIAWAGTELLA